MPKEELRAMTPIKEIWAILNAVFFLDFADHLNLMASCENEDQANATALALGAWHNKETYAFKPSHRRMVPLAASAPMPTVVQPESTGAAGDTRETWKGGASDTWQDQAPGAGNHIG